LNSESPCDPKLVVALDFSDRYQCLELVQRLDPKYCRLKIGKEMFTSFGPSLVEDVQKLGFDVFLDLKFHDIPNTVAKAVAAAARLDVWMVNVHASGGRRMMDAARNELAGFRKPPLLIAVTVLTSMGEVDLQELGISTSPGQQAVFLANMALDSQLDGVVCAAHEVKKIKLRCGDKFLCVTPGIRPVGSENADQRRIMTPEKAIQAGSDYLVMGRPVTQAADPLAKIREISAAI